MYYSINSCADTDGDGDAHDRTPEANQNRLGGKVEEDFPARHAEGFVETDFASTLLD